MNVIGISYLVWSLPLIVNAASVTSEVPEAVDLAIRDTYNALFVELSALSYMILAKSMNIADNYIPGRQQIRELKSLKESLTETLGVNVEVIPTTSKKTVGNNYGTGSNTHEKFTIKNDRDIADLEQALKKGIPQIKKIYELWKNVFYANVPSHLTSFSKEGSNFWAVDAKIFYDYFKIWFMNLGKIHNQLKVRNNRVTPSEMFAKSIYLKGLGHSNSYDGLCDAFAKPAYAMFAPISFRSDHNFLTKMVEDMKEHCNNSCSRSLKSYMDMFHLYTKTIKSFK
ncbi:signal peptide containing protein [Theileria equi strain WA]|uniref:Signal peptide containing protein n=1 Tax=Theileria equi strain WA TaxID=1537102 RepID=L1LGJ9_THEEQ|nr:signal peptide containing protein [Theileria equi strain WA]EKX74380.1 signal peptide containing protein [Theileria equi strain WA]|eukprot:XP_004833832.1 signal peptide containing protein [Theileria equi strain WA]